MITRRLGRWQRAHVSGATREAAPTWVFSSNTGEEAAKDIPRAVELYTKSCSSSDSGGCANLGYLFVMGLGVPRDANRGVALFSEACLAHSPHGCTNLGIAFKLGLSVPKSLPHAIELFEKTCTSDGGEACVQLAKLSRKAPGFRETPVAPQRCDATPAQRETSTTCLVVSKTETEFTGATLGDRS